MDLTERLTGLIEPTIDSMGYELVRVLIMGAQRQTVQIMIDRQDGKPIGVEDCADVSHAVSAVLDVEDPISGAYNLEVSSPGIDRPLTRAKDFAVWAGFDAKVEAKGMVEGRKRFSGRLLGIDEEGVVRIRAEDGDWAIPFDMIGKAKLVLTDALIDFVTRDAAADLDDTAEDIVDEDDAEGVEDDDDAAGDTPTH